MYLQNHVPVECGLPAGAHRSSQHSTPKCGLGDGHTTLLPYPHPLWARDQPSFQLDSLA